MKKFARKCDVTGQGMNCGWVWFDGTFYTSTMEVTLKELRSDIENGALDFDEIGADELLKMSDDELIQYANECDITYWTEWEDEDDYEYYEDENGNLIEI
jgi:hypothetical protein